MFPIESAIYALVPYRLWWAPWRWNLGAYWWSDVGRKPIATNITKAECIGLMKLLGYPYEIKP